MNLKKVRQTSRSRAKQIIRKFSGEWAAERYIEIYRAVNDASLESLKQDPNRKVVVAPDAGRPRSRQRGVQSRS